VRVLVIDESPEALELLKELDEVRPDAIIVGAEEFRRLLAELAEANGKLEERKLVERAKGVLMKTRGLDEDAAYRLLRKFAMDRKLKLVEVARQLIDASDLLGA
jgi:response regulator NasT